MTFRLSKFLDFQSAKKMYNSCIFSLLSYCIRVSGGTSRCDALNRIFRKIVENLFSKLFQQQPLFFRETIILKNHGIYKLTVVTIDPHRAHVARDFFLKFSEY